MSFFKNLIETIRRFKSGGTGYNQIAEDIQVLHYTGISENLIQAPHQGTGTASALKTTDGEEAKELQQPIPALPTEEIILTEVQTAIDSDDDIPDWVPKFTIPSPQMSYDEYLSFKPNRSAPARVKLADKFFDWMENTVRPIAQQTYTDVCLTLAQFEWIFTSDNVLKSVKEAFEIDPDTPLEIGAAAKVTEYLQSGEKITHHATDLIQKHNGVDPFDDVHYDSVDTQDCLLATEIINQTYIESVYSDLTPEERQNVAIYLVTHEQQNANDGYHPQVRVDCRFESNKKTRHRMKSVNVTHKLGEILRQWAQEDTSVQRHALRCKARQILKEKFSNVDECSYHTVIEQAILIAYSQSPAIAKYYKNKAPIQTKVGHTIKKFVCSLLGLPQPQPLKVDVDGYQVGSY